MPTLPDLSTIKLVAVEEPMARDGWLAGAWMEREAKGEVVPMPTSPNGEAAVEMERVGVMVEEVAMLQALTVKLGMVEVERFW